MYWSAIQGLAALQHGLVSRHQILAIGASADWLKWAVRDDRLTRVRQGVYAITGSYSEYQPLLSACLAGGEAAAVSHLAAAALWGAEQVKAGRVEITTFDRTLHRIPGVTTHCSRLDPARAITSQQSLPVVVPPLTVVQVAQTCHPYLAKSVANDLVKRHWTDFKTILLWVDLVGPAHTRALRDLCVRAVEVAGHDDSPAARSLCQKLARAGLGGFELDYQVVTPDGILLIDIAWPSARVGLEYNGGRDHDGALPIYQDARRRNRLAAIGWRMLDARRGMTDAEIVRWVNAALQSARTAS